MHGNSFDCNCLQLSGELESLDVDSRGNHERLQGIMIPLFIMFPTIHCTRHQTR